MQQGADSASSKASNLELDCNCIIENWLINVLACHLKKSVIYLNQAVTAGIFGLECLIHGASAPSQAVGPVSACFYISISLSAMTGVMLGS